MIELVPLCTALVEVSPPLAVGNGPLGGRSVSPIHTVTVAGDRLRGSLAGPAAADWMIRNGAVGAIDVRMTIRTDDDALIHITYGGRLDLSNPAAGITAWVAPLFETGDERYAWLNRVQAIGKGRLTVDNGAARIDYAFYEPR